uniref:Uncharacterized protein n=1 Tax=Kuenenia stuttgartiensis TaxID=174633 RepID=Q1Q6U7_KUEST|nr:unknown protein [Candidatus Kuenenia stuttgartiensis]
MFFVINIPPNTLEILPFQSYSCNKALPCLQDLGIIRICFVFRISPYCDNSFRKNP